MIMVYVAFTTEDAKNITKMKKYRSILSLKVFQMSDE